LTGGWVNRRRVQVRVHIAYFRNGDPTPYYFVNVTNKSKSRDVEITHVWFATDPPVHILNPHTPLDKRLQYDESWETWIEVSKVPADEHDAKLLARVRLSSGGKPVHSKADDDVPAEGFIPGQNTIRHAARPTTRAYGEDGLSDPTYTGPIDTSEPISLSGFDPPG
jgi:hypothetical protein